MRTLIIATFAAALSLVVNVSATEAGHGYGMHGHHGHHYGWGHHRGHHYGWNRGHHYGWRHHHRHYRY
jgi:Spy/CpxP family protein refolding chaperone